MTPRYNSLGRGFDFLQTTSCPLSLPTCLLHIPVDEYRLSGPKMHLKMADQEGKAETVTSERFQTWKTQRPNQAETNFHTNADVCLQVRKQLLSCLQVKTEQEDVMEAIRAEPIFNLTAAGLSSMFALMESFSAANLKKFGWFWSRLLRQVERV